MSNNQPTHDAYIVPEGKEGSDKKKWWHPVGAIFPHQNGKGFNLVIPTGISVTGNVVCIERKEKEEEK